MPLHNYGGGAYGSLLYGGGILSSDYGYGEYGGSEYGDGEAPALTNKYGTARYRQAKYQPSLFRVEYAATIITSGRPSGRFYAEPRLWKSDIYGTRLELVEPALPITATVTYNEDLEHKRVLTMEVANPDALRPLWDFVVPELYIVDGNGNELTIPLGHYLVTPPTVTTTPALRRGTIEGKDLTYLLGRTSLNGPYLVLAGTDTGEAARDTLVRFGIPARMIDIPDSGANLPRDMKWEAGDTVLQAVNTLLEAGGQYHLWTTGANRLRSFTYRDPASAAPVTTYDTQPGNRLVPPIVETPDWSRLRNRVVVRRMNPDEVPLVGRAEVTDRSSPLHPVTLQERMGASAPVYLSHTEDNSELVDQATADAAARRLLAEGASFYRSLTVETLPDEYMEGHQIVALDIADGDDHYYTGNWIQRTFTLTMQGAKATVQRDLVQTMRWE